MNDATHMTPTEPAVEPLDSLDRATLQSMSEAGKEIKECYRVLKKSSANIVGELLKGAGTFYEMDHYPKGDVYDAETFAQYYYHAHRGTPGEHGHFHTFLRAGGMSENVKPVPYDGKEKWPEGSDALSHLVAISMDSHGYPMGLFATNRWVTGETWYAQEDVAEMADAFLMDLSFPSWPVNRWISAMFHLYRPEIRALLQQRDEVVAAWADDHPGIDVFEDRDLEITGAVMVSVDRKLAAIDALL